MVQDLCRSILVVSEGVVFRFKCADLAHLTLKRYVGVVHNEDVKDDGHPPGGGEMGPAAITTLIKYGAGRDQGMQLIRDPSLRVCHKTFLRQSVKNELQRFFILLSRPISNSNNNAILHLFSLVK